MLKPKAEEHPLGQALAAAGLLHTIPSPSRPEAICLLKLLQEGQPIPATEPEANPQATGFGAWIDPTGWVKVVWQDGVILHGIQNPVDDEWEIHFIVCFGVMPERALHVAAMLAANTFGVNI